MDIGSLAGLLVGSGLVIASMLMGGGLGMFINVPSLMIVVGGTFAATAIAFPGKELKMVGQCMGRVFKSPKQEILQLMKFLVDCRKASGKGGLLALEELAQKAPNEAVTKGLLLVADATDPSALQEIMVTEKKAIQERHMVGKKIFNEMAKFAPAFGMVGTLIGLVQMLATLDDPSTIGPKMAVALLTTLYGALMANLAFLPMVVKLERRMEAEMQQLQLAKAGITELRAETSISIMREKLKAFLPDRADLDQVLAG
ncbi:MAG: motility protein A [Longimicrobiales bacterium]